MDPTAVAVVGTLAGVGLTSVTTLAATVLAQRHQQQLAQQQHGQEDRRLRREEMRTAFINYLTAYDAAFARAESLVSAPVDEVNDAEARWRASTSEEMARLQQAYLVLCITADREVREAANACLGTIWALGTAAAAGEVAVHRQLGLDSRQPRDRLREAMRTQLGVG